MNIKKKIQFAATFTFIIGFGAFLIYDVRVNEPKAAFAQHELEKDFSAIRPFDQAHSLSFHASHKTSHALVGNIYSTRASFIEIRRYYVQELEGLGWHLRNDSAIKDWGRDLGGKSSTFCKGQYTAALEYAGEDSKAGWTYALELSWGLSPLCSA